MQLFFHLLPLQFYISSCDISWNNWLWLALFELKPTFNPLYLVVCPQFTEQIDPGNKYNKIIYTTFSVLHF